MTYIKYLKAILYFFIGIIIFNLLLSLFYYFNLIKNISYFKVIGVSIILLIDGIYIGKYSNKKGWLEGLKIGLFTSILLFIISYLGFDKGFSINRFIYYILIITSTIIGGMIGINTKKKN